MRGKRRLAAALLAACVAAGSPTAAAPVESADDAFSLVQEQTVTGVAKRPVPLSETPSSVTVIPAAEIRAMGYHTLGEALRWVQGVFVTYDHSYTYVGVRGVQRPGDYNDKVLLTLDGHTINGTVYGDALFGPELGLDLEDVERIEVARGPGSTLYGSYAVLAVVNVVTVRPNAQPGVSADLRAGGAGEWRGHAALASARPGRPAWRASMSWLQAHGRELGFPASQWPLGYAGPASAPDGEQAWSFLGTAEWGFARLAAKFNGREKSVLPGIYAVPAQDDLNRTWDGRDFVELSATHRLGAGVELTGRSYWDGTRYNGQTGRIYDSDPTVYVSKDQGDGDVIGGECRANWAIAAAQVLTFGIEAQRVLRAHIASTEEPPLVVYDDRRLTSGFVAAYVQDEARWGRSLVFTAGARLDDDSRYDLVVSPRADLVWSVVPGTRLKLLGGSAFRAPTPFEATPTDLSVAASLGRLEPERVVTLEATLEHERGPYTGFLTAYQSSFRDLIAVVEVDDEGSTAFVNHERLRARGLEGGLRFRPGARTHARATLAWQRSEDGDTGAELSNSPRWNGHVLAYHTLRDGQTTLGAGIRYLSSRIASGDVRASAVTLCDARLARSLGSLVELGVEARNLFDARYGDPGWDAHLQDVIPQDSRSLFVTLSYPPVGDR